MGGNALAEFGAKRLTKADYEVKRDEVLAKLDTIGNYYGWVEIPSYLDKDSFGDLDILCTNIGVMTFDLILKAFDNPPCFKNKGVMSFLYKDLQVDIISMPPEDYNTAYTYYSYNDLGNLMGKIFHKFGMKYGHKGLVIPLRDDDNSAHKFGEVIISKDPTKIFSFLGLSYRRFLYGFKNLKEIFDFVIYSPYFDPRVFSFENMNNAARVRDRKRATYNAFLQYIEGSERFVYPNWDFDKIPVIFNHFPEAYMGYLAKTVEFEDHKASKKKFNGNNIMAWLKEGLDVNIKGPALGHFMNWVSEEKIGKRDLVISSEERIKEKVLRGYVEWLNKFDVD